jgi:hypothetical protein
MLAAGSPPKFGGIAASRVHYEKKEDTCDKDEIGKIKESFEQSRKRSFSFDREQRISRRESLAG